MSCFYCTINAPQIPKTNQKKKKDKTRAFFFFLSYFSSFVPCKWKTSTHTCAYKSETKNLASSFREMTQRGEGSEKRTWKEKATGTGINSPALAPCASLVFGRAHSNYSRSPLASLLVVSFLLGASRHLLHFNVFVTMATRSHDKKM